MSWEQLLGVSWPKNACDRSGECCRGAAQVTPWQNLMKNAASGDETARAFLNQYMPYESRSKARQFAPDAVKASLALAEARGDDPDEVVFYHCRYLKGQSDCQIYEDRPALCRDFPESPFGAIPACCGYASYSRDCLSRAQALRDELARLKTMQSMLEWGQEHSQSTQESQ